MFGFEIILASASAIAGILGLLRSLSSVLIKRKKERHFTFITKNGRRYEVPSNTSTKDFEKLFEILQQNENIKIEVNKKKSHKELGFVISEFFIYFVPGVIALLFAATFVYLLVKNQGNPNYTTPKELASAMTMIIGYFFGVGVSAAVNKGKMLTEEDVKKLIDKTK